MKHAVSGYDPCKGDEALGWITRVGSARVSYSIVRLGRAGYRHVRWRRKVPEPFRGHPGGEVSVAGMDDVG